MIPKLLWFSNLDTFVNKKKKNSMRKAGIVFASLLMTTTAIVAQNHQGVVVPQVQVNGIGKVSVTPDKVSIRIGVDNKADDANSAKKANDVIIAKVIKYAKSLKIDDKQIQTQRVNLYKSRDYEEKKDYFQASQTLTISLDDISKYEKVMTGLMDLGINRIDGVEFTSSKAASYETEARTLAVKEAKQKATDYANALGQKVGKAILVSDGTSYDAPIVRPMYMMKSVSADEMKETLAVGEIEVTSNVSISFSLE